MPEDFELIREWMLAMADQGRNPRLAFEALNRIHGDLGTVRARVAELEEREASVCPEDVGIVEYVSTLRAQVDELTMLVRMLVHSVHKTNQDNKTAQKAMDYLQRHNLQGSILRDILRDEADYGAGDCVPT